MKSLGIYLSLLVGFAIFGFIPFIVHADSNATVSATVTPELISVLVNYSQVDYGILAIGQVEKILPGNPINVKNNGTVNENFSVQGSDATAGSNTWALDTAQGQDKFVHEFQNTANTSWYKLSKTTGTSLAGNLSPNGSVDMKLRISMPTSITGAYTQYSTVVSILAVKQG